MTIEGEFNEKDGKNLELILRNLPESRKLGLVKLVRLNNFLREFITKHPVTSFGLRPPTFYDYTTSYKEDWYRNIDVGYSRERGFIKEGIPTTIDNIDYNIAIGNRTVEEFLKQLAVYEIPEDSTEAAELKSGIEKLRNEEVKQTELDALLNNLKENYAEAVEFNLKLAEKGEQTPFSSSSDFLRRAERLAKEVGMEIDQARISRIKK